MSQCVVSLNKSYIDGRYKKLKCFAKGELAETWLVSDEKQESRLCVLKILLKKLKNKTHEKELFWSEYQVLSRLEHPFIVELIEHGEFEGLPYFTLVYIEGEDLKSATEHADLNKLHWLTLQCFDVLHHLHVKGFYHLDLKPENIWIETSGRPRLKLLDFSLSGYFHKYPDAQLGYVGTVPYGAPELAEGKSPTASSDLYSMGVVLYELLTGNLPFVGQNVGELLTEQLLGRYQPVFQEDEKKWHGMSLLVKSLLEKNVHKRPQTVQAAIAILNECENENYEIPFQTFLQSELKERTDHKIPNFTGDLDLVEKQLFQLYAQGEMALAYQWVKSFIDDLDWKKLKNSFLLQWVRILSDYQKFSEGLACLEYLEKDKQRHIEEEGFYWEVNFKIKLNQGAFLESEKVLDKAKIAYEKKEDRSGLSRVLIHQAYLATRHGRSEDAGELLYQARSLSEEYGESLNLAIIHLLLGNLEYAQGNLTGAYHLYESSAIEAKKVGNTLLEARALLNQGNTQFFLGKLIQAQIICEKACQISKVKKFAEVLGNSLLILSMINERLDFPKGQIDYLEEAIAIFDFYELKFELCQAKVLKVYALWALNQFEEAKEELVFLQGQEEIIRNTLVDIQVRILEARFLSQGLIEDKKNPIQILSDLVTLLVKMNNKKLLWEVYYEMAGILESAQNQLAAKEYYLKSQETMMDYVNDLPESFALSFYRDRKHEKISEKLKILS